MENKEKEGGGGGGRLGRLLVRRHGGEENKDALPVSKQSGCATGLDGVQWPEKQQET